MPNRSTMVDASKIATCLTSRRVRLQKCQPGRKRGGRWRCPLRMLRCWMSNPTLKERNFARSHYIVTMNAIARERDVPDELRDVALTTGASVQDFRAMAKRMEIQRYCIEHRLSMLDESTIATLEAMAEAPAVREEGK